MPATRSKPDSALTFVLGECRYGRAPRPLLHHPGPERDRLIVELRSRGWTCKRIGKRVGMSESGVARSLQRIREGGFGRGMTRD
jgi:hypothetical protein